jgi:hypothetical protein
VVHGFNGASRTHWHKNGRFNAPMVRYNYSGARTAAIIAGLYGELHIPYPKFFAKIETINKDMVILQLL